MNRRSLDCVHDLPLPPSAPQTFAQALNKCLKGHGPIRWPPSPQEMRVMRNLRHEQLLLVLARLPLPPRNVTQAYRFDGLMAGGNGGTQSQQRKRGILSEG